MSREDSPRSDQDEARKAAIERVVAAAPPLTAEQIVTLRRIFASTPTERHVMSHEFDPLALLTGSYQTDDGKFPIDPFPAERRDYIFDVDSEGQIYAWSYESARPGIVEPHGGEPYETPDGPRREMPPADTPH